ncbi:MAG: hypothetical protein PUA49_00875 [Butyrivibrio sp.]|nr:hypothetical protein [Butyrivibrio sp.]
MVHRSTEVQDYIKYCIYNYKEHKYYQPYFEVNNESFYFYKFKLTDYMKLGHPKFSEIKTISIESVDFREVDDSFYNLNYNFLGDGKMYTAKFYVSINEETKEPSIVLLDIAAK